MKKKCPRCEEEKEIEEFWDHDVCYSCGQEQIEWEKTQSFDVATNR